MNRGQVGSIGPLAMTLIVAVIVIAMGSLILNGFQSVGASAGYSSSSFNNTVTAGQTTMTTVSSFLPLVGLAVVAAVIIGLFLGFMGGRK
jgi:hypothetical protein